VNKIIGLLSFLFSVSNNCCQVVQKITSRLLNGPDGMVVDQKDNIYIANWGNDGKGKIVIKIDKNGKENVYLDSLASPDGLTFDKKGNLYVSCFASGEVFKILSNKERQLYASGLDHPSDIKFDALGNLYASCFGNFNGTKVLKINPAGQQTVFVDSMSAPLGLVFDKDQNLYVSNFASGAIYKMDKKGLKTLYVQLPEEPPGYFQYLAFDDKENLYCPSFGHNCIYKIDKTGKVSKLRILDQKSNEAKLNGPNSIYIKNGDLYFTEFNTNSIYRLGL
jgi:sugar lactone lactonase YvrE